MENVVNPRFLSISTYLEKGGSMTTKSAIIDVDERECHFGNGAHTIEAV